MPIDGVADKCLWCKYGHRGKDPHWHELKLDKFIMKTWTWKSKFNYSGKSYDKVRHNVITTKLFGADYFLRFWLLLWMIYIVLRNNLTPVPLASLIIKLVGESMTDFSPRGSVTPKNLGLLFGLIILFLQNEERVSGRRKSSVLFNEVLKKYEPSEMSRKSLKMETLKSKMVRNDLFCSPLLPGRAFLADVVGSPTTLSRHWAASTSISSSSASS